VRQPARRPGHREDDLARTPDHPRATGQHGQREVDIRLRQGPPVHLGQHGGERAGHADLLSCILAFRHGFGVAGKAQIGDPLDLSWARRFGWWASYAFGQPLPQNQPGVGRNAFAHESGIHADGALKDRQNYELYDDDTLGRFPDDWFTRAGRVVLTGEYGGKAGFRHVLDGLGIEIADGEEDLAFSVLQLCASASGKPLTDDELRLIGSYPHELALLFPGLI
jgi:isopropylmalate/homocitrate/citramalate synthase